MLCLDDWSLDDMVKVWTVKSYLLGSNPGSTIDQPETLSKLFNHSVPHF